MYKIKRFNKCPDGECIQPAPDAKGKWVVYSGRTGKPWKARYDSKEKAAAALRGYFANKGK